MQTDWPTTTFSDENHALDVLMELYGKRWLCGGQRSRYSGLNPSIERAHGALSRQQKLNLERQSIDTFRSTARSFNPGEELALIDDLIALMVMRHYGVPTRLLDWSLSPYVAAYFASEDCDEDGKIWTFSHDQYVLKGNEQWASMRETTVEGPDGRRHWQANLTAFLVEEPPDWFVCQFYDAFQGFPRQRAQRGLFTMMARFGRGHDHAIAKLLSDPNQFHLYLIPSNINRNLLRALREKHGIWRGSLFPDTAGAAETVKLHIFERS